MIESLGIAVIGDTEHALTHVKAARRLVNDLRARMKWQDVQVLSAQLRLDGSTYVYAYAYRGTTRAVIVSGYEPTQETGEAVPATPAPDFVSGTIVGGQMSRINGTYVLSDFKPTPEAGRLHNIPDGYAPSARFGVVGHPDVPEVGEPPGSQYIRAKSTVWTGTMRIVVQAIEAIGKAVAPSIYDRVVPRVLDPTGRLGVEPTDYETQIATQGVRVRYGATFERSHGIRIADDGRPWLVEISITRGVLAMPLPMFPATALPRFRERPERLEDSAALDLLDRFGGIPSGEIFPDTDEALEEAIEGGFVLRLKTHSDLSGVYECSSYSPANSWAFSDSGHDAVTTAWKFNSAYLQRGSWWGVATSIGNTVDMEPPANAGGLKAVLAEQGSGPKHAWVLRKADRLTLNEVRALLLTAATSKPRAYADLDAMTLAPMATGSARLSKRGEGYLFAPRQAKYFPPIAYWHPFMQFCLTHDPRPQVDVPRPQAIIDTVMWVAYAGQQLQWVRYFDDPRIRPNVVEDDFEDCMYIGSWTRSTQVDAFVSRCFYSNAFDARQDLAGSRTVLTRKSRDVGWIAIGYQPFIGASFFIGELTQVRGFVVTTRFESTVGESIATAIVLPFGDRCAYYHALVHRTGGGLWTESVNRESVLNPTIQYTWQNIQYPQFAHPDGCGVVMDPKVTSETDYRPTQCSDYADYGTWAPVCADVYSLLYTTPFTASFQSGNTPQSAALTVHLVNASDLSPILVKRESATIPAEVDTGWFDTSPDPDDGSFISIDTWHNAWGDGSTTAYRTNCKAPAEDDFIILGAPQDSRMRNAYQTGSTFTLIGKVD